MDEITKAGVFDGMAEGYDEGDFHVRVADALLTGLPPGPELVLDVATGTGFAAFAALRLRPARVLGVDLSPAMIAQARAKAPELDPEGRITWQVGSALPMPVPDHSADVVVCASALHFLGGAAPADWRRALRPGGRVAFSVSRGTTFRAGTEFAPLIPDDLELPADEAEAAALAVSAGFVDVTASWFSADSERPRGTFVVQATAP